MGGIRDYFKRDPVQRVTAGCGRAMPVVKACCDRIGIGWLIIPLIIVIGLIGAMAIWRRK